MHCIINQVPCFFRLDMRVFHFKYCIAQTKNLFDFTTELKKWLMRENLNWKTHLMNWKEKTKSRNGKKKLVSAPLNLEVCVPECHFPGTRFFSK